MIRAHDQDQDLSCGYQAAATANCALSPARSFCLQGDESKAPASADDDHTDDVIHDVDEHVLFDFDDDDPGGARSPVPGHVDDDDDEDDEVSLIQGGWRTELQI